jgi:hypothetical protein
MESRSINIFISIILAAAFLFACSKDSEPETRSFHMGFTPFPYENSLEGVNDAYARIESDADIINHHFDNGVPWIEALNDQPFHTAIMADWDFRKSKANPNQKIYLSVAPLNFNRDGLAPYRGQEDNMALPEPWNSYLFNHVNVRAAYFNYCKRIIDYFKPDYFNMAVEANLLYFINPDKWTEYIQFHQYVYTQLKFSYPDLPIFTSVSGACLLPGFIDGNDHIQQRLAVLQLMDYSDLYGVSFYPYLSNFAGNPYPENTFDELFSISQKPLAIAETGYTAQSFTMNTGSGAVAIESDPSKQQKYINDLLSVSERYKALFVINYLPRDYDQLWMQIGAPTDLLIAWRDTGFYDENGNPRLALNTWKQFLSKKHQPVN